MRSGRAVRLEEVLRELKQDNVDVGVLHETNITYGIHVQQGAG